MKEVFTTTFWKGVKKTFEEARDGPAPVKEAPQIPAKRHADASEISKDGAD